METVMLRYKKLLQVYARLEHMVSKLQMLKNNPKSAEDDIIAYRDSVIKHFEMTYDLTWKFLKEYLEIKLGVLAASPIKVFRACYEQSLIDEQELQKFIQMVEDRNLTTHTYSEDLAEKVSSVIIHYAVLIKKLIDRLNIKLPA